MLTTHPLIQQSLRIRGSNFVHSYVFLSWCFFKAQGETLCVYVYARLAEFVFTPSLTARRMVLLQSSTQLAPEGTTSLKR